MSGRGQQLHATADEQIGTLIDLVATLDDRTLRLPCPGREKLGDGTIAASAQHTADNYQRIAGFVQTSDRMTRHDDAGRHRDPYTFDNVDLEALGQQLRATREILTRIALLTDQQLQTIPPDGSFRFCDGQRTLDQVLKSLFTHQGHQAQAIRAALA